MTTATQLPASERIARLSERAGRLRDDAARAPDPLARAMRRRASELELEAYLIAEIWTIPTPELVAA